LKKGFTLIELAIVVVVLGILVTGIIGGRSLIDSSKRQGLINDVQKYKTAFLAFKLEYDAVPGDFDEATQYFSGTNNGNGDDAISFWENRFVWQHLHLGGILNKAYDCQGCSIGLEDLGISLPEAPFEASGYYLVERSDKNASYRVYNNPSGHYLWLGASKTDLERLYDGAVTANWAKKLDDKIDDGKPYKGSVIVSNPLRGGNGNCLTPHDQVYYTSTEDPEYDLTLDTVSCLIFFPIAN
jgi:prepilin-type N-terminal cleavage/methylation domain-containing protein